MFEGYARWVPRTPVGATPASRSGPASRGNPLNDVIARASSSIGAASRTPRHDERVAPGPGGGCPLVGHGRAQRRDRRARGRRGAVSPGMASARSRPSYAIQAFGRYSILVASDGSIRRASGVTGRPSGDAMTERIAKRPASPPENRRTGAAPPVHNAHRSPRPVP